MIKKTIINPYEEARKQRLVWLGEFLSQNVGVEYRSICSLLQRKFGISDRTAREYIKAVVDGTNLKFINGKLEKVN